ncbi:hypothetical protein LINPERPRIM_LOCUS38128 [Linum perenne]
MFLLSLSPLLHLSRPSVLEVDF